MMKYKNKELNKYKKAELIHIIKRLVRELSFDKVGVQDVDDVLPDWEPPKVAAILYKGKGKAGGK